MANPIDKYLVVDVLKAEVDQAHKQAKADAEDFLAQAREANGTLGLSAPMFDGCGEFKYAKTRAKTKVEFGIADSEQLEDWVNDNAYTAFLYIKDNAASFGKWCQDNTGEVPDGIERTEVKVPAGYGAPKFYGVDAPKVKQTVSEDGYFFLEANQLLLGDGE